VNSDRANTSILRDEKTACREGELKTKRRGRSPIKRTVLRRRKMLKRESQVSRGKQPQRANTCWTKGTIERIPVKE
jgi:hypothetical protein